MWAFGLCLFYLGFCYTEVCYIPGFCIIYFTLTFARWKNIFVILGTLLNQDSLNREAFSTYGSWNSSQIWDRSTILLN